MPKTNNDDRMLTTIEAETYDLLETKAKAEGLSVVEYVELRLELFK